MQNDNITKCAKKIKKYFKNMKKITKPFVICCKRENKL